MQRIVRACKVLSTIIKIIFAVLCVYWVFTTCFMVYTVFTDPTGSSGGLDFLRIVLHLAYIAVIVALFVVINGMFTDVAKGQTPFAMVQVKRLRIISVLLVAYCVLDIAITSNNALLQYSGLNTGFVSTKCDHSRKFFSFDCGRDRFRLLLCIQIRRPPTRILGRNPLGANDVHHPSSGSHHG